MKHLKVSERRPLQGCQGRICRRPLMACFAHPSASGACQQSMRPRSKLSYWNAPTAWNVSAPPGSGNIPDMEKYMPWFRIVAMEPVGRCWGRDVLGDPWMVPTLAWTILYSWIFATTTANGDFARSVVVVEFALTTADATIARSVVVVAFALTTANGTIARSVVVVAFALTTADGTIARSVEVVAFALTTANGANVQCARLNSRPNMQWEMEFHQTTVVQVGGTGNFWSAGWGKNNPKNMFRVSRQGNCSQVLGRSLRTTGRFPHKRVQVKGNIQRGQHLSLVSTNLYYFNNLTSTSSLQIVTPLIILVNFLASAWSFRVKPFFLDTLHCR